MVVCETAAARDRRSGGVAPLRRTGGVPL